ncbi:MAG: UDP-N-acetylmuramate dehydrogenase [Deltaproteobacteria bacterium]|nr:UDP-N-acetylmuramate dehydrogenase [Deltaproteobacteria bacterium]
MSLGADDRKWLADLTSGRVRYEEPMSRHTSFRVGGPAEAFVAPETSDELSALVTGLAGRGIPYQVVGGGTNLIVTDAGISGVVISLGPGMSKILIENISASRFMATVMAGTSLRLFCSHVIRNGLKGMNFALGIPGTVGGAIRMNAGTALGWISDVLESITVLYPSGLQETIGRNALSFSYRKLLLPRLTCGEALCHQTIIVSGSFSLAGASSTDLKQEAREILKNRKCRQPVALPSAGCIFKNPPSGKSAGELIDLCGLKGLKIGGAQVSEKHANFIVNTGSAAAADILSLMDRVRQTVFKRFDVNLEPEVIVIGN